MTIAPFSTLHLQTHTSRAQARPIPPRFGEDAPEVKSETEPEKKAPQKTVIQRGLGIACNVLLLTDGRIGILKVQGFHNNLMAEWRPQQRTFYLKKAAAQYQKAFDIADAMAVKTPISLLSRYECLHELGKIYRSLDQEETARVYEAKADNAYALLKERLWPPNVAARLFKGSK